MKESIETGVYSSAFGMTLSFVTTLFLIKQILFSSIFSPLIFLLYFVLLMAGLWFFFDGIRRLFGSKYKGEE